MFVKDLQVRRFLEPLNGRSALIRFSSDGPVYTALVALYSRSPKGSDRDRQPKCSDFQSMLRHGALCSPRERVPSVPGSKGTTIYGRVAGISKGTAWSTTQGSKPVPLTGIKPGQTISYVLSSLTGATLGTDQVQSAPMIVRYPDTAYESHGNYAVTYDLTLPITNESDKPAKVTVTVQSPLKNLSSKHNLVYLENAVEHTFFRGTIRFEYQDDEKNARVTYTHLVEKHGEKMPNLLEFNLKPNETRPFRATFLYPPDSTPPQVLTFKSTSEPTKGEVGAGESNYQPKSPLSQSETNQLMELEPTRHSSSAKPETTKLDSIKTEATKSEGTKSEDPKTEGTKSEGIKTEVIKTEGTKTEGTKTEGTKTDGPKTEDPKSEVTKSESIKGEVSKSDYYKSGSSKSDSTKSESKKSGTGKTDSTKSSVSEFESTQSESTKSETKKSESTKSETISPKSPSRSRT